MIAQRVQRAFVLVFGVAPLAAHVANATDDATTAGLRGTGVRVPMGLGDQIGTTFGGSISGVQSFAAAAPFQPPIQSVRQGIDPSRILPSSKPPPVRTPADVLALATSRARRRRRS